MEKIPFDEVAFRNGAVAINTYGDEVTYIAEESDKSWLFYQGSSNATNCPLIFAVANWSMKPTDEDGWIAVNGKMPGEIAEAQGFEWEFRVRSGPPQIASMSAAGYSADFWTIANVVRLIKPREITPIKLNATIEKATSDALIEHQKKAFYQSLKLETTRQRLTREASTRYFEKLHAKEEKVLPLGEMGIEEAIFSALCESMKGEPK